MEPIEEEQVMDGVDVEHGASEKDLQPMGTELSSPRAQSNHGSAFGAMPSPYSYRHYLSEKLELMFVFHQVLFKLHTLLSIIFYSGITFIVLEVDGVESSGVFERLHASQVTVGFFSSFLGFSLVFRTNICYSRWWEGRCLWGGIIFAAINLVHQGKFSIHGKLRFRRVCSLVVCFAYACKGQISASSIEADAEHLLGKGIISQEELDTVTSRNGWQPYYFLTALRATIQEDVAARPEKNLYSLHSDLMTMNDSLRTLATSIGGLIRVKSTGLPIVYDWLFQIIVNIFFTVATLAWAPTLRWYTPILIAVLSFVVELIIAIGSALEDPFCNDTFDLPMDKFCEAITLQVEAIFRDEIPTAQDIGGGWPRGGETKRGNRESLGQMNLEKIGRVRNRRSTIGRARSRRSTVRTATR